MCAGIRAFTGVTDHAAQRKRSSWRTRSAARGAVRHTHRARAGEFPVGGTAGASGIDSCIWHGQTGVCANQPGLGCLGGRPRPGRRHSSGLPGNGRRPALAACGGRCAAGRRGHQHQHERERGDCQPRPGTAGRSAWDLSSRVAAGRHQPPPVHQRHVSNGLAACGHLAVETAGRPRGDVGGGVSSERARLRLGGQGGTDGTSRCRVDYAGPHHGRVCRGVCAGSLAHIQV